MSPKPDRNPGAAAVGRATATAQPPERVRPPVRPPDALRDAPEAPGPVNSHLDAASNRESRKKEAAEDRVLIEAAQRGDREAFRSLVERHQRRAHSIAFGLVRDENDAREVVQEAFLRVYKGLGTFEHGSSFFTWLYRIVTNLSIDLIRKPGRRVAGGKVAELDESRGVDEDERASMPMLARVDGADPADVVRRKEIADRIRTALEALPPYHRDVILLREVEGLSYEEMAEAMGVSKGTIMSRLFHARQKLQKALADCYAEQIGGAPVGAGGGRAAARDPGASGRGASDAAAGSPAEEEPS